MEVFKTPVKSTKINKSIVRIPPSPFMKKIGFGTGVVVYELQRSPLPNKLRSPWAIKKLAKHREHRSFINERLKTEAEILRKLNHPNIVGFRAFSREPDGTNILAMEECTSSLGDLIENRVDYLGDVPYPAETILKVSHDISKALNYLHNEMYLLHCDIKSFNILVKGEFEICKLCDFGVCLPLTKEGEVDKSKTGDEVEYTGTPCWSPPEVFKLEQEITTKADIYSFGLVLWEMIALSPPIGDENMEVIDNSQSFSDGCTFEIKRTRRPDLPDVELGQEYNLVLEMYFCCTAFDKKERPSAADLVRLLDEALIDKSNSPVEDS